MSWDDYVDMMADDFQEHQEDLTLKFLCIAHETERAWLITFEIGADFNPVQHWLPKSECVLSQFDKTKIYVPVWLVDQKELNEYEEN